MTMGGAGSAGMTLPTSAFGIGAGGSQRSSLEGRTQELVETLLKGDVSGMLESSYGNGSFLGNLGTMLQSLLTGADMSSFPDIFQTLSDLLTLRWDQVDGLGADVDTVVSNINAALTNGVAAGAGAVESVFNNLASLMDMALAANETATATATQLAADAAAKNGATAGGVSGSWSFPDDTAATDFTQDGDLTLDDGNAKVTSGSSAGFHWFLSNTQFATDDQSATIVLGNNGNLLQNSAAFVRANSDCTSGVYVYAFYGALHLGCFVRSGTSWTWTDWASHSSSAVCAGARIELRAQGSGYSVRVNDRAVLSHTDSAGSAPVGEGYRFGGGQIQLAANGNQGFQIASFAMSDVSTSTRLGSGARLYMASTTGVSLPGSGNQVLGASTFDTIGSCTSDMTVVDTGLGSVRVSQEGWYHVTVRLQTSSACGNSYVFRALLYASGVDNSTPVLIRTGPEASGTSVYSCGASWVVYCGEGTILQPGMYQAGSNKVVGSAAGQLSAIEIALINN